MPATAALSVQTTTPQPVTLVAAGRVRFEWDLSGERFSEHLLSQEVAKHPPTRLRSDSLMARRENWWWLPRVLITLAVTTHVRSLPARTTTGHALLARQPCGTSTSVAAPWLEVVTTADWRGPGRAEPLELVGVADRLPHGEGERAYVFDHRHSPDFERWERWYRDGTLHGDRLHPDAGNGGPPPVDHDGDLAPFNLLQRIRNHRRTVGAAKAGIAAAEQRHS